VKSGHGPELHSLQYLASGQGYQGFRIESFLVCDKSFQWLPSDKVLAYASLVQLCTHLSEPASQQYLEGMSHESVLGYPELDGWVAWSCSQ
jgi:hypothetical protein